MPIKAQKIWAMLGQAGEVSQLRAPGIPRRETWRTLAAGTKLGVVEGLFPKIDDKAIAAEIAALEGRGKSGGA
jgi:methionyl-tRNA synthetase